MTHELSDLQERLQSLRDHGSRVAQSLEAAAEPMQQDGTPPSDELTRQLADLHQEFLDVQGQLQTVLPGTIPNSIDEIERALDHHVQVTSVQPVLQQLLSLNYHDRLEFLPLSDLKSEVTELASQLHAPFEDRTKEAFNQVASLANGGHAWIALLHLVQRGPELNDEEWSRLNGQVEHDLGQPLAVAAARGRLLLVHDETDELNEQSTSPGTVDLCSDKEVAAVPPPQEVVTQTASVKGMGMNFPPSSILNINPPLKTPVVDETQNSAASEPAETESIFDEIGLVSTERAELAKLGRDRSGVKSPLPHVHTTLDGISQNLEDSDVEVMLESGEISPSGAGQIALDTQEQDQYEAPDLELKRMAEASLSCTGNERDYALAELIWRLIYEGRVGLAWHLSRGLEARGSTVRFVPSWLISAWATGLWILYPKGQLATRLADDLENFAGAELDRRATEPEEKEWLRVLGLLTRAATLRAAMIAPNTRAAAIVRAFPLRRGEETLYNYCSRIGADGEKLNGFYPGVLKQKLTSDQLQEELRLLRNEVRRWRQETANWAIRFEPAKPLFSYGHWSLRSGTAIQHPEQIALWPKWMRTLELAEEVLAPIFDDSKSELVHVRAAVDRLSSRVVVGASNEYPSGSNVIVVPIPEMRRYLREATTFAHRWLTLQSRGASDSHGFLPQAAETLISDVLTRHNDLFEELQENVAASKSNELRTATACLMLAAQQVTELLDANTPMPLHEPDVRHLLHAELLRFPDLNLDSDWLPDVPPIALTDRLLHSLTKPQPDWLTTFRMHERRQDHVATERLLMLNVWSESQRLELTARRHERLRAGRQQLVQTLRETTLVVREAAHQKRIGLQEIPVIDAAIEDLEYRIERSADIGNLSRQLSRLKAHMDQLLPIHLRKRTEVAESTDSSSSQSSTTPSLGSSLLLDDFD